MSDIFWTSDTHFYHRNIIGFCDRPYESVEEMNEALIDNWNATVRPTDTVYHNGDLAMGANDNEVRAVLRRLKGRKFITLGNHDERTVARHPSQFIGYGLFEDIYLGVHEIKIPPSRLPLVMCHYAMRSWNQSHRGSWHLYGHSHGTLEPYGKSVDVGIDSPWVTGKPEYRPFSYEEIQDFMAKADIADPVD